MAQVALLAPFILRWEGGFVNDPADSGGATMRGVTIATYKAYCRKKGRPAPTVADLKRLSSEEWTDILKTMYWDKARADEIHQQRVANIIVDWVWISGTGVLRNVQRAIGVTADGIVGPKTIAAINAITPIRVFDAIFQERVVFYRNLITLQPKKKRFFKGWMNRLEALRNL